MFHSSGEKTTELHGLTPKKEQDFDPSQWKQERHPFFFYLV
jgi:hypothetical protein